MRNDIPISGLIENVLRIPARTTEGVFRFLCPVCGEFNTSINFKTNLARCFCCKKNFNTIDLVMIAKNENFVKAVRFLKKHAKSCQSHCVSQKKEDRKQSFQHIGEIVNSIMPAKPDADRLESLESISIRVSCIEEKLDQMIHQMDIIVKTVT